MTLERPAGPDATATAAAADRPASQHFMEAQGFHSAGSVAPTRLRPWSRSWPLTRPHSCAVRR